MLQLAREREKNNAGEPQHGVEVRRCATPRCVFDTFLTCATWPGLTWLKPPPASAASVEAGPETLLDSRMVKSPKKLKLMREGAKDGRWLSEAARRDDSRKLRTCSLKVAASEALRVPSGLALTMLSNDCDISSDCSTSLTRGGQGQRGEGG